jgi:UDP-3-O-[3-hydroxymyristoyl] glucosamine N-acyltransferase
MLPDFFKKLGPIDINKIKSSIDCVLVNIAEDHIFNDFVSINHLNKNSLSFLYDKESQKSKLNESSTIICSAKKANELNAKQKTLIVKNVQKSVAEISNIFFRDFTPDEISKFDKPKIGKDCYIGNNVTIENGVVIGNNVTIQHGTVIKNNCIIGNKSKIGTNSVISHSIIGENIYIGNNSSIGQRGFGFYINKDKNINIYHTGKVILQSGVSIGSGCNIDRGSFSDTIIGENTYLDNMCHVAHNVEIGKNCAFAAMTGIAGSAKIGNNVLTGGQVGIAGHIKIGDNVQIAAKSGVFNNLKNNKSVMGNPAINKFTFIKNYKNTYGKR